MANITIFERDISNISTSNINNNIVYVPGYAVMGPINKPTLCRTLREFQEIFGTQPYIFETNQTYSSIVSFVDVPTELQSNGVYALQGSKELSYYYVTELLNQGLYVLFERVAKDNIPYAKKELNYTPSGESKFIIKAKFPGKFYEDMNVNLSFDSTSQRYTLIASYKIVINGLERTISNTSNPLVFSFNPVDEHYIGAYDSNNKFIEIESEFVQLSFSGTLPTLYGDECAVISAYDGKLNGEVVENEFSIQDIYSKFAKDSTTNLCIFDNLIDRGEYDLKFISSGVYPTFDSNKSELAINLLKASGQRGDCIGLVDYFKDFYAKVEDFEESGTLSYQVNNVFANSIDIKRNSNGTEKIEDARTYGTMFTPWANYKSSIENNKTFKMPGSFAYLLSLAQSVKTNPNWYAVAGVARAVVPNLLSLDYNITGAIADSLQTNEGVSINPITNIKPYGYTIWGNRTLLFNKGEIVATSLLNIRSLACDVKKVVYTAAKKFMFEPISDILWLNFKSEIEPTLDKMVSGNGLTNYRIIRQATTEKATISACIRLYAVEPVENFDITLEISDSYISVE